MAGLLVFLRPLGLRLEGERVDGVPVVAEVVREVAGP